MIYYDSSYAKVSWNEEVKAVVVEWITFAQGEQFRTPLEKALELMVQKKAHKYLGDTRKSGAWHKDDQEWLARDFRPRHVAAGLKFLATITPDKVVAQSSLRRVISSVEASGAVMERFDDIEDAIQWLSEVN